MKKPRNAASRTTRAKELVQMKQHARRVESDVEKKRLLLVSVEKAWREGQPARLAAVLQVGRPCPVCGSTVHPEPTRAAPAAPSSEEFEKIQEAYRSAQKRYEHVRKVLQSTEHALQADNSEDY